jgi:hypothetical protein
VNQRAQFVDGHACAMSIAHPNVSIAFGFHAAALLRTTCAGRNVTVPTRGPGFNRQFFLNLS